MNKCLLLTFLISCFYVFFALPVAAQTELKEFHAQAITQKRIAAADKKIRQYQSYRLPVAEIAAFIKNKPKVSFRLNLENNLQWNIELEPSTLASTNYKRTIITPEGKRSEIRRPDFLYKGRSLNKNGGQVRLAIKNDFLYGVVTMDDKEFVLEPASRYGDKSSNEYLLYTSDQVVADTSLKCGVEDEYQLFASRNNLSKKIKQGQEDSSGALCKTIQILQVTDYQMLETYNFNIDSLETFLFANLNISEAVFNSFNFNPGIDSDVGNDKIKFEVIETVISTCPSCDVLTNASKSSLLARSAKAWLESNYSQKGLLYCQFWSPRRIFSGNLEALGITNGFYTPELGLCSQRSLNFLKYYTSDPIGLRYLTVHELGHSLGAISHDDQLVPGMNKFFMTSYPVLSATRFSRASDFLDFPEYIDRATGSSQNSIRNNMLREDSCHQSCSDTSIPFCKLPAPPHVEYFSVPDSVKISWQGNGSYIVRIMRRDNSLFFTIDSFFTSSSSLIVKNLEPCQNYKVEVRQVCGQDISSWSVAAILTSTQIKIDDKKIINESADKHDLQLKISHNHNKTGTFYVFIDHKPIAFSFANSPQTIIVKDIFSDGANHRIDIRQFLDGSYCNNTYSYKAPYYRQKSKLLLLNDFNETCTLGGWNARIIWPDTTGNIQVVNVFEKNNDTYFEMGNLDSTCYLHYSSLGYTDRKTVAITSPVFDASQYDDLKLSFDYQYWVNPVSRVIDSAYISAEVFDGNKWHTVFKKNRSDIFGPARVFEGVRVWDSLPPRVFKNLDSLKSQFMQIRFIAELGTNDSIRGNFMFLALDNIRVDGYSLTELNYPLVFKAFPNPVQEVISLEFSKPVLTALDFRIVDMSGRVVKSGKVATNKISVTGLQHGIYLLQVFDSGKRVGKPVKFFKR